MLCAVGAKHNFRRMKGYRCLCFGLKGQSMSALGNALTVPHKCSAESAEFRGAIVLGRCESWGALVFPLEAVAIFAETETVHAMTA